MDIWGSLISAVIGLMTARFGGEGGNRDRVRPRRTYVEVRIVWQRGGASW